MQLTAKKIPQDSTRPINRAWSSTILSGFSIATDLALDVLQESPSMCFSWNAPPGSIAALWTGKVLTFNHQPPFEQAFEGGRAVGLDLSRGERGFHYIYQSSQGPLPAAP